MAIPISKITTDGFTMQYFTFGDGPEVFVMIPGISIKSVMFSAEDVAKEYKEMKEKYTLYVFDRRSEIPSEYSISDMARDTAAAMKALGLESVNLFGASQGGMISMVIAAEYPELVKNLILGSTTAEVTDEALGVISKWIGLAKSGEKTELCQSFGEEIYPKEFYEKYKGAFAMMGKVITDEELERFIIIASGCKGFDFTGRLGDIKCPVLVLGAADDRVLGSDAAGRLAAAFAGRSDCDSYIYDGYGHAAFDMAPDYRQRMMEFIGVK